MDDMSKMVWSWKRSVKWKLGRVVELWILSKSVLCFYDLCSTSRGLMSKADHAWSWYLCAENSFQANFTSPLCLPSNFRWFHVQDLQLNASKCQIKKKVDRKKEWKNRKKRLKMRVVTIKNKTKQNAQNPWSITVIGLPGVMVMFVAQLKAALQLGEGGVTLWFMLWWVFKDIFRRYTDFICDAAKVIFEENLQRNVFIANRSSPVEFDCLCPLSTCYNAAAEAAAPPFAAKGVKKMQFLLAPCPAALCCAAGWCCAGQQELHRLCAGSLHLQETWCCILKDQRRAIQRCCLGCAKCWDPEYSG